MRQFIVVSLMVAAFGCAGSADAAGTYNSSHSNVMTLAAMPSSSALITMVRKAHAKALADQAYTSAIFAKDVTKTRALLVKDGAPADVVVKISDKRPAGGGAAEKSRITITVTCCPLTITIEIR